MPETLDKTSQTGFPLPSSISLNTQLLSSALPLLRSFLLAQRSDFLELQTKLHPCSVEPYELAQPGNFQEFPLHQKAVDTKAGFAATPLQYPFHLHHLLPRSSVSPLSATDCNGDGSLALTHH